MNALVEQLLLAAVRVWLRSQSGYYTKLDHEGKLVSRWMYLAVRTV